MAMMHESLTLIFKKKKKLRNGFMKQRGISIYLWIVKSMVMSVKWSEALTLGAGSLKLFF